MSVDPVMISRWVGGIDSGSGLSRREMMYNEGEDMNSVGQKFR